MFAVVLVDDLSPKHWFCDELLLLQTGNKSYAEIILKV